MNSSRHHPRIWILAGQVRLELFGLSERRHIRGADDGQSLVACFQRNRSRGGDGAGGLVDVRNLRIGADLNVKPADAMVGAGAAQ